MDAGNARPRREGVGEGAVRAQAAGASKAYPCTNLVHGASHFSVIKINLPLVSPLATSSTLCVAGSLL